MRAVIVYALIVIIAICSLQTCVRPTARMSRRDEVLNEILEQ